MSCRSLSGGEGYVHSYKEKFNMDYFSGGNVFILNMRVNMLGSVTLAVVKEKKVSWVRQWYIKGCS